MTVGADQIAGAPATQGAASDWEAVHASAQIQFAPLPDITPKAPEIPAWLQALGRLLEAVFAPIGRLLGMSWPVFQWVLLGLAALLVLYAAWRLLRPVWDRRWRATDRAGEDDATWAPRRAEAEALLADADRLAAQGHFDEATHLLLRRSVRQIVDQRPDWLHPASTAREIARLPLLPALGRAAFTVIAERVERSRYALRALDAQDWSAAREAYVQFAAVRLRGGEAAA